MRMSALQVEYDFGETIMRRFLNATHSLLVSTRLSLKAVSKESLGRQMSKSLSLIPNDLDWSLNLERLYEKLSRTILCSLTICQPQIDGYTTRTIQVLIDKNECIELTTLGETVKDLLTGDSCKSITQQPHRRLSMR